MKTLSDVLIDIGTQFSRFPAGRFRDDGPFSGQRFREDLLLPALLAGGKVTIALDGALGFGSSFLEESFGGIFRHSELTREDVMSRLAFVSADPSLVDEIREYIDPSNH